MTLPRRLSNLLRTQFESFTSARRKDAAVSDSKPQTTLARGHRAETAAAEYLTRQGLTLIDRNVRAGQGEIDLIMQDGSTLVFVEVRARKVGAWVSAEESISRGKRLKVIETAERLLNENPAWRQSPCRFDVVAIGLPAGSSSDPDSAQTEVNWIQDAFQAE